MFPLNITRNRRMNPSFLPLEDDVENSSEKWDI